MAYKKKTKLKINKFFNLKKILNSIKFLNQKLKIYKICT